jgi:hypothetical protein
MNIVQPIVEDVGHESIDVIAENGQKTLALSMHEGYILLEKMGFVATSQSYDGGRVYYDTMNDEVTTNPHMSLNRP